MSLRPTMLLLPVLSLLATPSTAQDDHPLEARGAHFKLVSHVGDEKLAKQALDVVEKAWTIAAKTFGSPRHKVEEPFAVHLHRGKEAYQEAERQVTEGRFADTLGFADPKSMTAHVALQPEVPERFLREHGLNSRTVMRLAHEATHLCRFALATNHAYHPDWFIDGSAYWVGKEVLSAMKMMGDVADHPYFSTQINQTQRYQNASQLPSPEEFLAGATGEVEDIKRFGVRGVFFDFLMQKKYARRTTKGIESVIELGEDAADEAKVRRAFDKSIKAASLRKPFEKYLKDAEAHWNEQTPELAVHGDTWTIVAGPKDEDSVFVWRTDQAGPKPWTITGKLTIQPGTGQQINLFVGSGQAGFLSLGFVGGDGVWVFEYRNNPGDWQEVLVAKSPHITLGTPFPFEVLYNQKRKRELVLKVSGEEVFRHKFDDNRPMDGLWGVGAQPGSFGQWKGVKMVRS